MTRPDSYPDRNFRVCRVLEVTAPVRYPYLLFDADNTLFDFDRAEETAFNETMRRFGLPATADFHARYHLINAALWKALEKGEITLAYLRIERFRRLLEKELPQIQSESVAEAYVVALGNASFALPDGPPLIDAVKRAGAKIALVTNGIAQVQRHRLSLSPYEGLFDAIVISEEVGFQKPDPHIVTEALRLLHCADPAKALMIGDTLSSDIAAAQNAGVDCCWYAPRPAPVPCPPPTYTVAALPDILPIVLGPCDIAHSK